MTYLLLPRPAAAPRAPASPSRFDVRSTWHPRPERFCLPERGQIVFPRRAAAVTAAAAALNAGPPVPAGVTQSFHTLPCGLRLEVLSASPAAPSLARRPPLVFVHGSYHAAWCWAERWIPYFVDAGWDCRALSLRGQGGGEAVPLPVAGTLQLIAADLAHYLRSESFGPERPPPVLIAHSFGGLVAQLLAGTSYFPQLSGLVLLASAPPSGNQKLVGRTFLRDPLFGAALTYAFITRAFATNAYLCRASFFSPGLPEADVARYMASIERSCPAGLRLLDLRALVTILPIRAPPPHLRPPTLVVGGDLDRVVDVEALEETAAEWGAGPPVVLRGVAHDLMLDQEWREGAGAVRRWLEERVLPNGPGSGDDVAAADVEDPEVPAGASVKLEGL